PADLPSAPRIIGYFGAIAGWFDVELVSKVANQMPDTELVLIGEVSTDISKLSRVTNISLLGEKPYSTLPDYLAYFDLAIIPFRQNELTRLTDPVKIYEYLAGGIPVLSVDLPELHKFKDVVELAADEDEFIGKAEEMLVEGRGGAEKRYNAVKEETWLNRAVRLKELLHLAYYDLFLADNDRKERVSAVEGESKAREENEEVAEDMVIKVQENTEGWVSRLKRWLKAGGDE
ncbi:MAG: glycosyltransferase, partial [Halanaerobiales bacterium]|nr:glycosyltransferase [Halanaerobiales bacterium]